MYDNVNVLSELERFHIAFEWAGETEIRIKCPFHTDDKPSCNISVTKRLFLCHAQQCAAHGDIITLLAKIVNQPRSTIIEDLSTRYDLDETKIVEPAVVEAWHDAIWHAGVLLQELYKRGVTDKIIKQRLLGCDGTRITIPVPNARGDFVNVRKYLPGAPGPEKMKNMRGRGAARIYPEDQLRFDMVMLCGGEVKALVAAEELNQHNIGAVCATQGEKLLPPQLISKFAGKSVPICQDIDVTGRAAAELNCRAFKGIATEIFDIVLPLDINKYPKGDINDYIAAEGGKLWPLIDTAELWQPTNRLAYSPDDIPDPIHLSAAANAKYAGKRVAVTAIVTAMDTAPYPVPKEFTVNCDKSLGAVCSLCPVFPSQDGKFCVPIESPAILEVVSAPKRVVHDALMSSIGIPRVCRVCAFDVDSYYNAEDVRLVPQLEITNRAEDQKMQPAICIGDGLLLNEPYKFAGRMFPHPQTQQATLLLSHYEPTRDALSTYEPQQEQLELLDVFRPDEWTLEALTGKLDNIYDDFANTVTGIYQRPQLHLALDLFYHSVLWVTVDNRAQKGWVEILALGDSAQGKSETVDRMLDYYQLGEKLECKNMSAAGLLGGLQQMSSGRWIITWGMLPRHDRRALILEELKGMSTEIIGKLTNARSSGIAELSKIEKQRTWARTRLFAISNVRPEGRSVASYNYGIEALKELIGGLEDLRRFDMCLVLAEDELDREKLRIQKASRNGAHTKYSAELCRALILWAWTREAEQAVISKDIQQLILDETVSLCREYSSTIPIVDTGSMGLKLARLSAALAARTFSTDDTRLNLVVRECHVEYICRFLRECYSTRAFGYKEFSDAINLANNLIDPEQIQAKLAAQPFPYDLVGSMLRTDKIELQDLCDWCGSDRVEANGLLSFFVRKHALKREGRSYRKTGLFIEFLRRLQDTKDKPGGMPDRPSHLPVVEM